MDYRNNLYSGNPRNQLALVGYNRLIRERPDSLTASRPSDLGSPVVCFKLLRRSLCRSDRLCGGFSFRVFFLGERGGGREPRSRLSLPRAGTARSPVLIPVCARTYILPGRFCKHNNILDTILSISNLLTSFASHFLFFKQSSHSLLIPLYSYAILLIYVIVPSDHFPNILRSNLRMVPSISQTSRMSGSGGPAVGKCDRSDLRHSTDGKRELAEGPIVGWPGGLVSLLSTLPLSYCRFHHHLPAPCSPALP